MSAAAPTHSDQPASAWFLLGAVFVIFLTIFLANSGSLLFRDPDLLWHVTVGRRILETRSFPWVDEFSHTFRGQPWIAKEWLSQVVLALTYDALGLKGLAVLTACAIAATFTLLFQALAQRMRVVPALIGTLFAYSLATPHFLARPHILSFPLIVLWMSGLVRATETRSAPHPLMLAVMVVWANLHGGFPLGLVCIVPFALEAIVAAAPAERAGLARRWAVFLGCAALAALVTPYGYRTLWATYQVLGGNEVLKYIIEWQPFDFARDWHAGGLILLALFGALLSGVRLPLIRCALVVGVTYQAFVHNRFVALAAVVIPIFVAGPLARQFVDISNARPDPVRASMLAVVKKPSLRLVAIVAAAMATVAAALLPARSLPSANAPAAAVDFLESRARGKKIYNDFGFGGYLIFRGIPTFVDGRNDQLFGGGFFDELERALNGPTPDFRALLDRYDISFALVRPKTPDAYALDEGEGWRKIYSDGNALVFERVR